MTSPSKRDDTGQPPKYLTPTDVRAIPAAQYKAVETVGKGRRYCPYCGYPLRGGRLTCPAHSDLPARDPLDGRYALTETGDSGDEAKP